MIAVIIIIILLLLLLITNLQIEMMPSLQGTLLDRFYADDELSKT